MKLVELVRPEVHSPSENQTEQGADEDEDLVEHGGVGPLDGTMEVILDKRNIIRQINLCQCRLLSTACCC